MAILRNAAYCRRCKTEIESRHRHDFVECKCGNFVDGGRSYLRRGGRFGDLEERSVEVPDKDDPNPSPKETNSDS